MKTYQILSDFLKVDEMDHVLLSPQNQDAASPHAQMPDTRPSPPDLRTLFVLAFLFNAN